MGKKYKFEYLPIATKDLTEILEYIELDNPQAALRLLNELDSTISNLEIFPYMGIVPKDFRLERLGYRMLIVNSYLVFYIVLDDVIEIRRIIYGKRKYGFLL